MTYSYGTHACPLYKARSQIQRVSVDFINRIKEKIIGAEDRSVFGMILLSKDFYALCPGSPSRFDFNRKDISVDLPKNSTSEDPSLQQYNSFTPEQMNSCATKFSAKYPL